MKSVYGWVMIVLGAAAVPAMAADDAALRYQSKGLDQAVYRLVEVIDDTGGGSSATTAYVRFVATPGINETDLTYVASMSTRPMATGGQIPGFDPNPNFFDPKSSGNRVTIDRFGKMKGNVSHQDTDLPGGLGQNWEFALPELSPKGETSWHTSRPMSLIVRPRFGMMMMGHQATPATRTYDYTLGAPDDDAQSIDVTTDINTDGQGNMSEHVTGKGSLVFDRKRGLMQSLNEKLDASITLSAKEYKAAISLDMQLLTAEQVDKLKADADAANARMAQFLKDNPPGKRARQGGVEVHPKHQEWADQIDLPFGAKRTDYVGDSDGGGPFVKAGDGTRPVIGLRLRLGSWANHKMIGNVEPLFDKPDDAAAPGGNPSDKETVILATDGYVVGGLWMNGPDYADALRVIFMKKTATGVDTKDAYVSPWFGQPIGPDRIKLGCTGQLVVGVYGRQGLNTNALGLVMLADANAPGGTSNDPTDDPNFQGTKPAAPVPPKDPAK